MRTSVSLKMNRFFASLVKITTVLFGLCVAVVSGVVAYFLWRGAHWLNLESTYTERQRYESNPLNSLWYDLASGFWLYIPALIFAGIAVLIGLGFIFSLMIRGEKYTEETNNV